MSSGPDKTDPSTRRRAAEGDGSPAVGLNSSAPGFFNGLANAWGGLFANGATGHQASAENAAAAKQAAAMSPRTNYAAGELDASAINHARHGTPNPGGQNWMQNGTSQTPLSSQFGGTGSGTGPQQASMLSAFANHGGGKAPDSLAGTGGYAPAPDPLGGIGMPTPPTMNIPGESYSSYLAQAQNALNFGAIAQPYDQAINQVTNDTGISVGNIGAAAKGAQGNIAAGSGLLQQTADHANANNAAVERALAQQAAGANASNGATTAAVAQALGTGTLQGQLNSSAGEQNAAAQQYLAASALDNSNTVNANAATQIADNQNYGRVVDAKATADQQNAELAGQDAKVGIGMQKGSALLGAREQAATNAMGMQQNGIANALAQFQAQAGLYGTESQNAFGLAGLGLQEKQFEAGQTAAQAQALQQYLTDREGAMEKILQFGGTNPEVSGQMVQDVSNYGNLNPYLAALGGGGALPLNVNTAKKYNLGGY